MTAGESADDVARRSAAAAVRLEKSAQRARHRAESFAAGAEGERILAESLAGLAARGWFMLPDRRTGAGGNIDMVLVGPPGVFVLDAKHWSGVVSGAGLAQGRFDRTAAARTLAGITADVRASLGNDQLPASAVLVLTHEANRAHRVRVHEGVTILGVDHLPTHLLAREPVLTGAEVEAVTGRLMTIVPPVGAAARPDRNGDSEPRASSARTALFNSLNAYYYVQPWSRAGRRRLYLNDEEGATVAYKDLVSGVIAVTDDSAGSHVRDLLQNASASSLGLTKGAVPKVAANVRAGKLLSSLTRLWMTFHIGHRWRKGTVDRLYCVRANPRDGVDDVGYIDLTTGALHPVHERALGVDLATPRRYLELHRDAYKPRV